MRDTLLFIFFISLFVVGVFLLAATLMPGESVNPDSTTTPAPSAPTSIPSPAVTETPVKKSTIDPSDDKTWLNLLKSTVSQKVVVDSLSVANGRPNGGDKAVVIGYTSSARSQDEFIGEMAWIIGAFLGAKKEGWDIDSMMAVVGNQEGKAIGMWYCKKEWADKFVNGELELSQIGILALNSYKEM